MFFCDIFPLNLAQNFKTKVLTAQKNLLLECLLVGSSPVMPVQWQLHTYKHNIDMLLTAQLLDKKICLLKFGDTYGIYLFLFSENILLLRKCVGKER